MHGVQWMELGMLVDGNLQHVLFGECFVSDLMYSNMRSSDRDLDLYIS